MKRIITVLVLTALCQFNLVAEEEVSFQPGFLHLIQFPILVQEPASFEIDFSKALEKKSEKEESPQSEESVKNEESVTPEEPVQEESQQTVKQEPVVIDSEKSEVVQESPIDKAKESTGEMKAQEEITEEQVAATEAGAGESPTATVAEEKPKPVFIKDMQEAVRLAIDNHPALAAARKARQSAHSIIGEAEGELYPSVDLRAAIGREESENSTVINDGDQHRTLTPFEGSILIRQNLYTGGRITSNIAKREYISSEAFHSYLDEKEKTVFNAIDAYLEYCRNRSLISLADENVKVHDEILKTVEERKNRGMARDADVIQVKGRLALAKAQYQRELANRSLTKEQFNEAIGFDPSEEMSEPIELYKKLPESLGDAKLTAMHGHPLLSARKFNVKSAKAAAEEADGVNYPQVAIELRAQENDNIGGTRGNDDTYSAMLVVNWNIFRGGADSAVKMSRVFEAAQAEDLLIDEKRKIVKNTAISWHDYKGILVELNYFLQHEKAMKDTLDAYNEQYKLNQRTLFDLLNAQNELFLASSRVIETKYAKIRGVYAIFGNMGNISKQFSVVSQEAN